MIVRTFMMKTPITVLQGGESDNVTNEMDTTLIEWTN